MHVGFEVNWRYQTGMTDLKNPQWMWLKAMLLAMIGLTAAGLIIVDRFEWKTVALLVLVVWSFCRAYYFAFYVIEHYVDGEYKFAGLLSFCRYAMKKRSGKSPR
jgi:hypothetical protein